MFNVFSYKNLLSTMMPFLRSRLQRCGSIFPGRRCSGMNMEEDRCEQWCRGNMNYFVIEDSPLIHLII
jgi:hypothetical protein